MANRTVRDAHTIHGKNPQNLIEKVIRNRIYECRYWKEDCFALSCELLVDKACELRVVGGVIGGQMNPTSFLCLLQKLLQLQPEKDIIIEFIKRSEFKYARALGAMYMRLTGESTEIYKYLEPLYNDYRKLRFQNQDGSYKILHMDEFIDDLLTTDYVCTIVLPRLQKRRHLEALGLLEPRISILDEDIQEMVLQEIEEEEAAKENLRRELAEEEERRIKLLNNKEKELTEINEDVRSRRRSRSRDRRRSSSPNIRKRSPKREHRKRDKRDRSESPIQRKRRDRSASPPSNKRRDKSKSPVRRRERSNSRNRKRERSLSPRRRERSRSKKRERKRDKNRDRF